MLKSCTLAGLLILIFSQLTAENKPNIVFILADDLNRDSLGAYGNPDCKTPNIDRLAKEGTLFEKAYCTVAMCAPFRQELYSGKLPWRTGTLANHSQSNPETKSIPHYLKPLGYRTALLGKTHINPTSCYPFEYIKDGSKKEDCNDHYLEQTAIFIESCQKEKAPFCLFIASNDSHAPFTTGDPSLYDASKLTVPPYWIDTPELRNEMVNYYAEITNFDHLVGRVRQHLEDKDLWNNTVFIVCSEQGTQLPFAKWTCYDNGLHTGLIMHMPKQTQSKRIKQLISISDITPTLIELAGGTHPKEDFDGQSFVDLLHGKSIPWRTEIIGAFTNCNIIDNRERIFPIRVIRNQSFTLIYNANYKSHTSNVTITPSFNYMEGKSELKNISNMPELKTQADFRGVGVDTSWVIKAKQQPELQGLVNKLHIRPEYELYNLDKDPHELVNEIKNPEYQNVVKELKNKLHQQLAQLNDADPIATEKSLVKVKKKKKGKKN